MKFVWPWVGRRSFDLVCEERDRLRIQVDSLLDHTKRLGRVEHGLYEIPREQRPVIEPMPPELAKYIQGFAFAGFRKTMRDIALKRRARGESWASIVESIKEDRQELNGDHEHAEGP